MQTLVLDTHLAGLSSVTFQLEPLALCDEKEKEKKRKKRKEISLGASKKKSSSNSNSGMRGEMRRGRGVAAEAVAAESWRANYRCANEGWASHFFRTVFGYCSGY